MALQATFCSIKAAKTKLSTKEDAQQIREEMERLRQSMTTRIEQLEDTVMDLQNEKDKLAADISKLQGENSEMRAQLSRSLKEANAGRSEVNDNEQHGRLWNVRVYGIREAQGDETVDDCAWKCVEVFSQQLRIYMPPSLCAPVSLCPCLYVSPSICVPVSLCPP